MHKLLQRQLRRARGGAADGPTDIDLLLQLVDAAYAEVDRERRITAHAHEVFRREQQELLARQIKAQELIGRVHAEKAEAERARAVAEAELLKQERLSVLGQLTATVAHELRNPLGVVANTVFSMRQAIRAGAANLDRPIERIERSIARCDRIISELLGYARARDLNTKPLMLDEWLTEVLDEQRIPADITVERRLGARDVVVPLDSDRFRSVVINLLDNAVQAMHSHAPNRERCISVTTLAVRPPRLIIEDTGPGIAPEIIPRIFEPLFSTKSFGTGLGLPTVKQIVEQHDGTIEIRSEVGRGTRVEITLPAAEAPVKSVA